MPTTRVGSFNTKPSDGPVPPLNPETRSALLGAYYTKQAVPAAPQEPVPESPLKYALAHVTQLSPEQIQAVLGHSGIQPPKAYTISN